MNSRVILTSIVIFLFISCASQKTMYNKAKEINTIKAYQEFLQKYPQGDFSEKVRMILANMEFQLARQTNTIEAFEAYLTKYTDSEHSKEANNILTQLEFNQAIEINTPIAYKTFVEKYPKSEYVSAAKEEYLYHVIIDSMQTSRVLEYLENYPNGKYIDE